MAAMFADLRRWTRIGAFSLACLFCVNMLSGTTGVPGFGVKIQTPAMILKMPNGLTSTKSQIQREDDENARFPMGYSANGRWFEGMKRGHPDVVKRVATPEVVSPAVHRLC